MGTQEILVLLLFAAAIVYFGRILWKNMQSKKGCSSGCGKCGVDFSDVDIKENSK